MPLTDKMPTAAKAVSAVLLAMVGWFGANAIVPLLPEQTQIGLFKEVAALIGILVGWRVVGRRVQGGFFEAISGGLTGAAALVFWNLFAQSMNEMLGNALDRQYGGPFEGLIDVFYIAIDYSQYLVDSTVLGIIIGGSALTGIVANRFA